MIIVTTTALSSDRHSGMTRRNDGSYSTHVSVTERAWDCVEGVYLSETEQHWQQELEDETSSQQQRKQKGQDWN